MKEKDILVALDMAEDKYIEEASPENEKVKSRIKNRFKWVAPVVSAVACLCVVTLSVLFLAKQGVISTSTVTNDDKYGDLPIKEGLTVWQVDDMLFSDQLMDAVTNYYKTEYYPSEEYLAGRIKDNTKSHDAYLPIYEQYPSGDVIDIKGAVTQYEDVINRFSQLTDTRCYEENLEIEDKWADNDFIGKDGRELFYMTVRSYEQYRYISFYNRDATRGDYKEGEPDRILGGLELTINYNRSDEELMEDILPIREQLFLLFDREFENIRIERDTVFYYPHIYIYFYNSKDAESGYIDVMDDYIMISFERDRNNDEGKMFVNSIDCIDYHKPVEERVKAVSKAEAIALEEAEELLRKGYVFADHVCELCMKAQEGVDFENYDFVEITYIFDHRLSTDDPDKAMEGLPFYTFYKKIGDTKNGRAEYAVTNVCALKLTGYEDYFVNEAQYHR